jgi:hypothetical protein
VILAIGGMDPNGLTKQDHKKHGAIYFSFRTKPNVLYNKKTNGGKATAQIEYYDRCQSFAEQYFGPHMPNDTTISVEMNLQNKKYNKLLPQFQKAAVIPHGAIAFDVPSAHWTNDWFNKLCQETVTEGFVVVNLENGDRFKLKHENFPSDLDPERKRDGHDNHPTNFSEKFVGYDGLGYDNVALDMIVNGETEEVTIAVIDVNGINVRMVGRPIRDIIDRQFRVPFDGEKMMNFYKTVGQGPTYRYSSELFDSSILGKPLDFQMKFDGETALVHKDINGVVHLMIKVQVDVFEIETSNGSTVWRFGWI